MVTSEELNAQFDKMQAVAMKVKRDRDRLLAAAKYAFQELDERYDVDQEGEHAREIPFSGAGEVIRKLRAAIEQAEGAS